MFSPRLISTATSALLLATGIFGGIHGNAMQAQAAETLAQNERVATFAASAAADAQNHEAKQARAALDEFQPTIDSAVALVASSADKASQESRNALQSILDEFKIKTDVHTATGTDFREVVKQSIATATPKIASASQVVTDEVTAWQAGEDARIEAERVAAEEAARASYGGGGGGGYYDDSDYSGSGSSGGGYSGGGSSSGRAWAEAIVYSIAPNVSQIVWDYAPLGGSYGGMHRNNVIYLSDRVADGSGYAYSILVHEATHAGPQRGSCYATWQGHFGGDPERFTQAYTLANFGTTVDAYAYPTQADLAAAGSC